MFKAISGDNSFIEKIENTYFNGKVHSTFERTINITDSETDEMYTLATREVDNAPNTIITDIPGFSRFGLKPGDEVITEGSIMTVAQRLSVDIENVEKWSCILPEFPNDFNHVSKNLSVLREHLRILGKTGGMLIDPDEGGFFEKELSRLLETRSETLVKNLLDGKIEEAFESAEGLIGLGRGLTPSGDDFLSGVIATFNIPGCPAGDFYEFGRRVVHSALDKTNPISWWALEKSSYGQVRESIAFLIQAILYGDEETLPRYLEKVLSIGSTSGTDIGFGLLAGIEINLVAGEKK
ncbi:DUF2877 domain-containing protein [Bacillus sp. B-jedd]|uniref:DUF2877 domain-containing protein n=1 Tax=Bacillus sp. B-jedd TaxID=1476857 RepID=UPI000515717A|nr:DUF2877 domain-containing protein [Bacillus sp. B-jedd]CEG25823.1 hypothetical protein BN1002_00641 [Bacillus sp. B-jedd]